MIRYGVLCLGVSYAALWFVNLGGDAFRISALALLVAGLVLVVLDIVAPAPACPCEAAALLDAEVAAAREQLAVDDIAVGPLTAGTIDAVLVVDDEPELRAARVRGYIDPDTTGPIPIVQPLDLDKLAPARHRVAGD